MALLSIATDVAVWSHAAKCHAASKTSSLFTLSHQQHNTLGRQTSLDISCNQYQRSVDQ